jgi:hypothetical protein
MCALCMPTGAHLNDVAGRSRTQARVRIASEVWVVKL